MTPLYAVVAPIGCLAQGLLSSDRRPLHVTVLAAIDRALGVGEVRAYGLNPPASIGARGPARSTQRPISGVAASIPTA